MARTYRRKSKGSKKKGGEQSRYSRIRQLLDLRDAFQSQLTDLDFILNRLACNKTNNCSLHPEYKDWVAHRDDGVETLKKIDFFFKYHNVELVNDKLKYDENSMMWQGQDSKLDDLLKKINSFEFNTAKKKFEVLTRDMVSACAYESQYGTSTICISLPSQQKQSTWWKKFFNKTPPPPSPSPSPSPSPPS